MAQKIKIQDGAVIYTTPDGEKLSFLVVGDIYSDTGNFATEMSVGSSASLGKIVVNGGPGQIFTDPGEGLEIFTGISGDLSITPGLSGSLTLEGYAFKGSSLKLNNYYWPNNGADLFPGVFLGASDVESLTFYSFYIQPNASSDALTSAELNSLYPLAQPGQSVVGPTVLYTCVALGSWVTLSGPTSSGGVVTGNLTFTNGATITGLPDPIAASDAANKNYVDGLIQGLSWKDSVLVASTNDVDLLDPVTDIFDGVGINPGDRVLIKDQIDDTRNGIYLFQGLGSPMVRAIDASTDVSLEAAATFVEQGDTQTNTQWTQIIAPVVIGVTPIIWSQFGAQGVYFAGAGLILNSNTFEIEEVFTEGSGPFTFTKVDVNTLGQVISGGTLDSSDITDALGYTPYPTSNPSGFINSSAGVIGALGYTPYSASNPAGFISFVTSSMVTSALGYTPYNATNPAGFISNVVTALGYTPANIAGDTFTGAVSAPSFNATSSKRYKSNVKKLNKEYIARFSKLVPREFDWNETVRKGTHDFGFVAEEVYKIYPEIVGTNEQGEPTGVDYGKLTTILTAKINDLNDEIKSQRIIIDDLTGQMKEILKMIKFKDGK